MGKAGNQLSVGRLGQPLPPAVGEHCSYTCVGGNRADRLCQAYLHVTQVQCSSQDISQGGGADEKKTV